MRCAFSLGLTSCAGTIWMWPSRPNQCLVEALIPFKTGQQLAQARRRRRGISHRAGSSESPVRTERSACAYGTQSAPAVGAISTCAFFAGCVSPSDARYASTGYGRKSRSSCSQERQNRPHLLKAGGRKAGDISSRKQGPTRRVVSAAALIASCALYRFAQWTERREACDLPVRGRHRTRQSRASGDFPRPPLGHSWSQPGNCRKGIVCANRRVTTPAPAGSDAAENAPADKDLRSLAHVMKL